MTGPDTPSRSVAIIGGGVIGLTAGVTLQLLGLDTVVVADRSTSLPAGSDAPPDFATLHAAASVLPHSVRSARAVDWTQTTSLLLNVLESQQQAGIRTQRHFEVFEASAIRTPDYANALDGFAAIGPSTPSTHGHLPYRRGAAGVSGWSFNAYFCEGPPYLAGLVELYKTAGGTVVAGTASIEGLIQDGWRAVVVCAGHRSPELARDAARIDDPDPTQGFAPVEDAFDIRYILGHYLRVPLPDLLYDRTGRVISYSYHPTADVYAGPSGAPADVYCYPRHDAWLLGGSRLPFDSLSEALAVAAESGGRDTIEVPTAEGGLICVPRPIYDLNRDLIGSMAPKSLDLNALDLRSRRMWGGVGLRAERSDPADSTRVEASRVRALGGYGLVLHNYGHGGAGFTLSWGCAVEVARLILYGPGASAAALRPDQGRCMEAGPLNELRDSVVALLGDGH